MGQAILLAALGAAAGGLGAMVGLGGGVFLVPAMSLLLGIPIHQAVAASAVAVIATSTTAAVAYVRDELANVRLGMLLEVATTIGALAGGLVAVRLSREHLSLAFGAVLLLVALSLSRRPAEPPGGGPAPGAGPGVLSGRYRDPRLKSEVRYEVRAVNLGMAASLAAGAVSGLLGIGGGPIKVPVMVLAMGVPLKAAAATSNFMIGVTAATSATVYYGRGLVNPAVALPVILGVTAGAYLGARLAPRASGGGLKALLTGVLIVLSVQMLLAGMGASWR